MLHRGDVGADVSEWQLFLRSLGYRNSSAEPITVNGDFDGETEFATSCFQHDNQLDPTGILCPETGALARKMGWRG